MSKSVNKFHYVDEDGKDTSPEMATRITLLVYDEKQKISRRVDWTRDDVNTSDNCKLEKDNEVMFTRTDAIQTMKEIIAKLMDDLRRTESTADGSGAHRGTGAHRGRDFDACEMSARLKIQELAKLLIDANVKLDEMIWRIFAEGNHGHCDGENCNHE